MRCFETGLRSDTCAATWGLLPSFTLTLVGFIHPLGIWHQRIRQLTIVIILILCGIIFVTDVGYFAEYDSQFDHWIVGLIYDDRSAILTTIWKSYPIVRLILLGSAAVAISAWALNKLCRVAAAADVPRFLGTKSARAITFVVVAIWMFVGAKVWLGKNLAGLKNAAATGDAFLNKIVLNPFFALRYAIWQETTMQKAAGLRNYLPDGNVRLVGASTGAGAGESGRQEHPGQDLQRGCRFDRYGPPWEARPRLIRCRLHHLRRWCSAKNYFLRRIG